MFLCLRLLVKRLPERAATLPDCEYSSLLNEWECIFSRISFFQGVVILSVVVCFSLQMSDLSFPIAL